MSKWGFCGTGTDYCGPGCLAGPCSGGGGGNTGGGVPCLDPTECRSKWGFCGKGIDYCGAGCLAGPCSGSGGGNTGGGSGGTFQGDATHYSVSAGFTACGTMHSDNEYVAALNAPQFDPNTPNGNPNLNSLCNKLAKVTGPIGTVTVKIVDKCPGCKSGDLDLSEAAFRAAIGDLGIGRARITWSWL
ncbi:unnamed protein product [Rotaria sordida]|uniref:Chitin-binding type-1 domain-containing protein n=1 Tax=Rotaria sordida TaxID=392033 RepID=A0A815AWV9_9BILA|nr:unnamed protein product [Rotaria sordida]